MGVRIVRIPSALVDRREPCRPPLRHPLGKRHDQPAPLQGVQLTRQGHGQLVDHAGVLTVAPFLPVQPPPRGVALGRHSSGQQVGAGLGAGDVAKMRARRPGRVGGLADTAQMQAVNRHNSSLPARSRQTQDGPMVVHRKPALAGGCNGGRAPLPRGVFVYKNTSCYPLPTPSFPARAHIALAMYKCALPCFC